MNTLNSEEYIHLEHMQPKKSTSWWENLHRWNVAQGPSIAVIRLWACKSFSDASSHLYKRVCPSVRPSVRPSIRRSVRRSVRNAFVKIAENGIMQDGDASYVVYTALFSPSFLCAILSFLGAPWLFFCSTDSSVSTFFITV